MKFIKFASRGYCDDSPRGESRVRGSQIFIAPFGLCVCVYFRVYSVITARHEVVPRALCCTIVYLIPVGSRNRIGLVVRTNISVCTRLSYRERRHVDARQTGIVVVRRARIRVCSFPIPCVTENKTFVFNRKLKTACRNVGPESANERSRFLSRVRSLSFSLSLDKFYI